MKASSISGRPGWVRFDASGSIDMNGNPCTHFVFDFGDGTPCILIESPVVSRPYPTAGGYTINLAVTDKYGQQSQSCLQINIKIASLTNATQNNNQCLLPNDEHAKETNTVNKNKKSKKKKKKKKPKSSTEPNYQPPPSSQAIGNITISRSFTEKMIPSAINVKHIRRLYASYMNKLTALQWNDNDEKKDDEYNGNKYNIGDKRVLDYDFHDKQTGDTLYCLITRQDASLPSSRNYEWIMEEKLYNKSQLQKINISPIPTLHPKEHVKSLSSNQNRVNMKCNQDLCEIIQKIPLNQFVIYNKQNIKKDEEIIWPLSKKKFIEYCESIEPCQCIPIVMSYDNMENGVHYLIIVKTECERPDIGVSVKYDAANDWISVSGIHIDKQSVLEQHQLAMPYPHNESCNCLDEWEDNTNITHLIIGDKNHYKYETERLKRQLEQVENTINRKDVSTSVSISTSTSNGNDSLSPSPTYGVQGYSQ